MSITDKVISIITEIVNPENRIEINHHLVDDIRADRLESVEIIMEVEDEFDLEISDFDAERLVIVEDIIKYVEKEIK